MSDTPSDCKRPEMCMLSDECIPCHICPNKDAYMAAKAQKENADMSIRITDALATLDDLEKGCSIYGGFQKRCLKKIRTILEGGKYE